MDPREIKAALAQAYDAAAEDYERLSVPVMRGLAKRLLQYIDLRPGWRVLDAGTGTGLLALAGAPRVGKTGKMIGIDPSEKMLAIARRKAAQYGFTQCEFERGDLEGLRFPDAHFQAALSQFVLHHTDFPIALRELARVLEPGGWLVLQDWSGQRIEPIDVFYKALASERGERAEGALAFLRAQSDLNGQFYRAYAYAEGMRGALAAAGFDAIELHEEQPPARAKDVDAFLDLVLVAPLARAELEALPKGGRESVQARAREALMRWMTPRGFEWNYYTIAVVARKRAA
ncbi:MAG: methyltransferase domain-containing protein [Chloroflexi bacterium]|nr:methyltransferase domain-containing protein [Chloroflexota bacterium]